jgi:hypothetical protein
VPPIPSRQRQRRSSSLLTFVWLISVRGTTTHHIYLSRQNTRVTDVTITGLPAAQFLCSPISSVFVPFSTPIITIHLPLWKQSIFL